MSKINYWDGMNKDFTTGLANQGYTNDIYGNLSDDMKLGLSNDYASGKMAGGNTFGNNAIGNAIGNLGGGGLMESLGGFGGVMGGLASLADTWMNYSALKAQKNSARDAHNASAQQVNNNRARSASVGKSVFGGGYKQTGKDIASSTV